MQRSLPIIIAAAVVAGGAVVAYALLEPQGPSRRAPAPARIAAAPVQDAGGRAEVPIASAVEPAAPAREPREAVDAPAGRNGDLAAEAEDDIPEGDTELSATEPEAEALPEAEPGGTVAEPAAEPVPEVAVPEPVTVAEPVPETAEPQPVNVPEPVPELAEAEPVSAAEPEPELAEAVPEPTSDAAAEAADTAEPEGDAATAAETVVAAIDEPDIADGLSPPESAAIPAPPGAATDIVAPPPAPPAPLTEPDAVAAADSTGEPAAPAAAISDSAALSTPAPAPAAPTAEPGAASPLPPAEVRPRDVEAPPNMTPPSFDIVHISGDGHSVFAGRAEPGAAISVMDGDEVLGSALADARGEWVMIPDAPLPAGSRELGIAARGEGGTEALSESVVVLHVPESPGNAEAAPSAIDHDPIAVSLPRGDTGIARLMQSGEPGYGIEGAHGLSLDSISYDAVGSFSISGRAQPDNEVAAYLDEHGIGRTHASRAGDWTIMPEETVDPGFYTLRVDQLDEGGTVVSQIQTPFTMADVGETDMAEGLVVVQPGNSLWRIARRVYGRGTQHTIIFQANRDQIKEAKLIYPGQIFLLPTPPDGE